MLIFSSCANEISHSKTLKEHEMSFLTGEKPIQNSNSYIINGKLHHPFLFGDQLDVIKDESVTIKDKTDLVFQAIQNHIETNGISEADQFDVQKLILYLYGDYTSIDKTLEVIQNEHHKYYLKTLIDFKAIDFKYLAKISKFLNSNDSYVLPKSEEYLNKYKKIVLEKDLNQTSRYGVHCFNILDSCHKAIEILNAS